jgi:hypothetical protein
MSQWKLDLILLCVRAVLSAIAWYAMRMVEKMLR